MGEIISKSDFISSAEHLLGGKNFNSIYELKIPSDKSTVLMYNTNDLWLNKSQIEVLTSLISPQDALYVTQTDSDEIHKFKSPINYHEYEQLDLFSVSFIASEKFDWVIVVDEGIESGIGILIGNSAFVNKFTSEYSNSFSDICDLINFHYKDSSRNPHSIEKLKKILSFLHPLNKRFFSYLEKNLTNNDYAETVCNAQVLLNFIHLNVTSEQDRQLLTKTLIILSDMIQQLETKYFLVEHENKLGAVIARELKTQVHDILEKDHNNIGNFIVNTVSQTPVTNTVLANWVYFTLKYYGVRVPKKLTAVQKALRLYDHITGSGVDALLLDNTKENVEKSLKIFNDIGLDNLTEIILGFYSCKTSNEKKRFLSDIKDIIKEINITEYINIYLTNT